MDNKTIYQHYRYKTIVSTLEDNKRGRNRDSSLIKDTIIDANRTMTHYKSIRDVRRRKQTQKKKEHKKLHTQNNSQIKILSANDRSDNKIGNQIMEIVKMRIHKNVLEKQRVKTDLTMNRDEFQHFTKKKKPTQFTVSRSVQQIRKMFPKRIDSLLNQLKERMTQTQNCHRPEEKLEEFVRPMTASKRLVIRGIRRYKTKNAINIESPLKTDTKETKETNILTQFQEEDVCGWEIQPIYDDQLRNRNKLNVGQKISSVTDKKRIK